MNPALAIVAAFLALLAAPVTAGDQRVVLVVDAASPVDYLDPVEVRKVFLRVPVHRDGRTLRPVVNASDPRLEQIFLQHVVAMSRTAYDRRMLTLALQHGVPRPAAPTTRDEVLAALRQDRLAITFAWERDVAGNPRVRIVRILWQD